MNNRLCLFPYYGGKARLSKTIAGIIDSCMDISIYIEPFGGAGSVLLNKVPHSKEIYNEQSPGMCSIFELLKDIESGRELIRYLYEETEFSEECFKKFSGQRNLYEDTFWISHHKDLVDFAIGLNRDMPEIEINVASIRKRLKTAGKKKIKYTEFFSQNRGWIPGLTLEQKNKIRELDKKTKRLQKRYWKQLGEHKNINGEFYCQNTDVRIYPVYDKLVCNFLRKQRIRLISSIRSLLPLQNYTNNYIFSSPAYIEYEKGIWRKWNDVGRLEHMTVNTRDWIGTANHELAAYTYVTYKLSRNGAGENFRGDKFETDYQYKNSIIGLYNIMERVKDIEVDHLDAMSYFNGDKPYIYMTDVLMYCDPSYLAEDYTISSSKKEVFYKKIHKKYKNRKRKPNDNDLIKEAINFITKNDEYNPGHIYKEYWTREEHERFLKYIQKARCKFIVSNYRDREGLYDRYLNADYGWRSLEYPTKTTVSQNASDRTEVLWYNF